MRKANIYELIDPITNEVRYIGKTTSPKNIDNYYKLIENLNAEA